MQFPSVSVAAEVESTQPFAANSGLPSGQKLCCSLKEATASTVVADAGAVAAGNAAAVVFAEGDGAGFAATATVASVEYLKETVTFAAAAAAGAKKYLTA